MKALIVCHQSPQDSGMIKTVLEERGFEITTVMGYQDKLPGIDPLEHDVTVVMGGPMGVYQADLFPYLNSEIAYLQKRLAADKPILGICLGAQLMAKALGKDVYKGKQGKEIGWLPITVLDHNSPVRYFDESLGRVMQWHGDTFDLPDNATLLASSDLYKNQIYSHGKRAIALQCHVEVTRDILETWMAIDYAELEAFNHPVPHFRAEVKERAPLLEKQMRLFMQEWLDRVLA